MRSSGGTNFELPCSVVARTKSSIACFAGPSFHDWSERSCVGWVCAVDGRGRLDKAGSSARPEISTRRLMSDNKRPDSILCLLAALQAMRIRCLGSELAHSDL